MLDLLYHPDLAWQPHGVASLSGVLLGLYVELDRLFQRCAAAFAANEHIFPVLIAAKELHKIDYFRNFPHLITVAAALDPAQENLIRFRDATPFSAEHGIDVRHLAPVHEVLTPAACYHCYIHYQGRQLDAPLYLTTRCACFRREQHYLPLQRQWNFSMREIVCVGTAAEVHSFLAQGRALISGFCQTIGLPHAWQVASDPFFLPSKNPKFLLQKLDPTKEELTTPAGLAIGSINFHRNYFGEAFHIQRDNDDAFSGCIAFGLERWIYAILEHYGKAPECWPTLTEVR